ncbi:hypothetical protein [Enterobacter roggenkampii]|uniref:hypothetical protein n=1 Tax=Enterobacter roggenkampii TaxID=1812935 RepID=UPI001C6FF116|nr:hypothetical protein [Enterobacter roggenkampii]MBW9438371.1 hypothetical protein [Enterobacter roggenkampii]
MKFAYFYASSPEISYPEIPIVPPLSAIMCIECDEFPKKVDVALNMAIVGLAIEQEFFIDVTIFCNGKDVKSDKDAYEPFRVAHRRSSENDLATRYSFIDTFLAERPGIYTFVACLYEGSAPTSDEDKNSFIDRIECSVAIAKEWR